jgi:hypothetical protein
VTNLDETLRCREILRGHHSQARWSVVRWARQCTEAGTSVVPRDSRATAEPHFFGLVAERWAQVFGAGSAGADVGVGATYAGTGWVDN